MTDSKCVDLIKLNLLENLQVQENAQNLEILAKVVNIFFRRGAS